MSIKIVSRPGQEPVTLEEAKQHLRVEVAADDALIAALLLAAREWVEGQTGQALVTQTIDWFISYDWHYPLRLPINPVQSVTSVKYLDDDGVQQTLATDQYRVMAHKSDSYIEPAYGVTWPSVYPVGDAIEVRFVVGHIDDTVSPPTVAVPFSLRTAVLLLTAHFYENREATSMRRIIETPMSVEALISPYRHARVM